MKKLSLSAFAAFIICTVCILCSCSNTASVYAPPVLSWGAATTEAVALLGQPDSIELPDEQGKTKDRKGYTVYTYNNIDIDTLTNVELLLGFEDGKMTTVHIASDIDDTQQLADFLAGRLSMSVSVNNTYGDGHNKVSFYQTDSTAEVEFINKVCKN